MRRSSRYPFCWIIKEDSSGDGDRGAKTPADIFQELLDYLWNGLGLEEKGWKRLKKGDFKKKMKNGLTYQIWLTGGATTT